MSECWYCGKKSENLDTCTECLELFCPVCLRQGLCMDCWDAQHGEEEV